MSFKTPRHLPHFTLVDFLGTLLVIVAVLATWCMCDIHYSL